MKTYHYQITALHGGSRVNFSGTFKACYKISKLVAELSAVSQICYNVGGYGKFASLPFKTLHIMCWSNDGGVVD